MILLVIDAQKGICDERLYAFDVFAAHVKQLIETARAHHKEIIYIRHDDGAGQPLTKGNDEFEIYEDFKPQQGEKIFDKKVNSAFRNTGLLEYLKGIEETEVMITGLQTDYCIDASVKSGFEHGLQILVPTMANTTMDNQYMSGEESYHYYNDFIWNHRYAKCVSMEEAVELLRGK